MRVPKVGKTTKNNTLMVTIIGALVTCFEIYSNGRHDDIDKASKQEMWKARKTEISALRSGLDSLRIEFYIYRGTHK